VVLVTSDATLCGVLPSFEVETPWWHDAGPVVSGVRKRHGIEVTLLRILDVELSGGGGGAVTYLAEVTAPVVATPWTGTLDEHPLRMPWARPGGPARDLAWADAMLAARGMRRSGPAEQVRTWNLSSIWRLPVEGQTVWLKAVPPFFAHEGRMLARLQGGPVPVLLGHDDGRALMADIPGDDLYEAPLARQQEMAALLVELQREWSGRTDELLELGLPDWRPAALARAIGSVIECTFDALSTEDRETLARFVHRLPDRLAAVTACGLPQTLVHGDFHAGNLRGDESTLVLLDWGDSGVGHPLLDEASFFGHIPPQDARAIRAHWHRAWCAVVPGSDPRRASRLLAPAAAARRAVTYREFLDRIEPSEAPYHQADPAAWLARAAALVRRESDYDGGPRVVT
jgi:Ser/Thr protein kinase RdoA (MazF antagonist)